ncbi:DNA helicase [Sarracenia purpurea var. burkii]
MSSMAPGENLTPRLSNRFSILSKPSEEANMDLEKNTFDSARREEKPTEEQGGAIVPRDVDEDVCVNIPREYEQVQHKVARAKRITMVEVWFEEELDALWLGVRRYGPGNWEAMLKDPTLRFSKFKTSEDLSERWKTEKQIILHCEKSQAHINLQPELQSIVSSGAYYEAARPRGLMKIRRASTSSRQSLVTVEAIKLRPECQTSNLPFTSLPLKNKKKPMDGKSKATKKPKPGLCNTIMDVGRTDDSSATESELSLKEWCARKEMSSEGTISD